jgi:hypothetical protein
MEPTKPASPEDIVPEFRRVGEPGWADEIRTVFKSYGVPLPNPATEAQVSALQDTASGRLPQSFIDFMCQFGPASFGDVEVLIPSQIRGSTDVWFFDRLSRDDRKVLSRCLTFTNRIGSDNFLALDLETHQIRYLCHDPLGVPVAFASFDDFVLWALVGLYAGEYGWPDDEVVDLVDKYQRQLAKVLI